MEEFRLVPGYGAYSVSTSGDLCRVDNGHVMTPIIDNAGYIKYSVRVVGKVRTLFAHRAVALAWIGDEPAGAPCVAHLDGNKQNNHVNNLKWVSYAENETHKEGHGRRNKGEQLPASKLTDQDVQLARELWSRGWSINTLSRNLGVSRPTMRHLLKGKTWTHVQPLALRPASPDTGWRESTDADVERVAVAIEKTMFAPHEFPLSEDLHGRYLVTARAAITSYHGQGGAA